MHRKYKRGSILDPATNKLLNNLKISMMSP
jgi:zinc transporter ZupT